MLRRLLKLPASNCCIIRHLHFMVPKGVVPRAIGTCGAVCSSGGRRRLHLQGCSRRLRRQVGGRKAHRLQFDVQMACWESCTVTCGQNIPKQAFCLPAPASCCQLPGSPPCRPPTRWGQQRCWQCAGAALRCGHSRAHRKTRCPPPAGAGCGISGAVQQQPLTSDEQMSGQPGSTRQRCCA